MKVSEYKALERAADRLEHVAIKKGVSPEISRVVHEIFEVLNSYEIQGSEVVERHRVPMKEGYPQPTCIGHDNCDPMVRKKCKYKDSCGQVWRQMYLEWVREGGTQDLWEKGYRVFDMEGLYYRVGESSPKCPKCGNAICSGTGPGSLCYECEKKKEREDVLGRED